MLRDVLGWGLHSLFDILLLAFRFIISFGHVIMVLTRLPFLYTFTHILPLLPTIYRREFILTCMDLTW